MEKLEPGTYIKRYKCKQGKCFKNAFRVWQELQPPGAVYVEGYVAHYLFGVITHGWLEVDGAILDVTPGYEEYPAEMYFPAIRYRTSSDCVLGSLPMADLRDEERFGSIIGDAAVFNYKTLMGDPTPAIEKMLREVLPSPKSRNY